MKTKLLQSIFLLVILITACENFPTNPLKDGEDVITVNIEHINTAYVETETPVEGIASDKVNILSFQFKVENFNPKAIEFFGIVVFDGPPEQEEHALHFRTDTLSYDLDIVGYEFNTLNCIESEAIYTLNRPKYPTNNYSPFEGDQGKIIEITFTEIWAIDQNDEQIPVVISGY